MKKIIVRFLLLTVFAFTLSACFGPKTPQDVTSAFWEAVLENNVNDAVEHSTLTDAKYYDGFSKNWLGYQPSFGKVVIEDKQASVESSFASPANSGLEDMRFTTYLLQRDGKWFVDYDSTANSIHGGPLGDFLNQLNKLGKDISREFESSAGNIGKEIESLGNELARAAESFGQQASESIEKHAEQLRQDMKALQESIERALKDKDKDLNNEDRRTLQEVSSQLSKDNERLAKPSAEAVSEGTRSLGQAQQQLDSIDNASLSEYKQKWHQFSEQFAAEMRQLLDELSAADSKDK